MQTKPQLGERCVITGKVAKQRKGNQTSFPHTVLESPVQAIYVGWRVVHEGETSREFDYSDDHLVAEYTNFQRSRSLYVWLFVVDERRNPVYVLPQDVQKLPSVEESTSFSFVATDTADLITSIARE